MCVGVLTLLLGCGTDQTDQTDTAEAALSPSERQDLVELAVSAEQLPPLRRTRSLLFVDDVVAQAALSDLGQTLDGTGFRGGVKVEYRGVSPRLTGVESQVLAFSSEEGAAEFSEYLAQHAASFFGDPIKVEPIVIGGRDGWRIDPPVCDCAGAQPLSAGAVHVGSNVVVLQITGPKADPKTVRELLAASLR
jgi:hypothetical protein